MIQMSDFFLIAGALLIFGCAAAFFMGVRPRRVLLLALLLAYLAAVLGLTLFPIPYQEAGNALPVPHNFVPFGTIRQILRAGLTPNALVQIGGNLLISLPYGAALGLWVKKKAALVFLPFLFPLVIESLQLVIGLGIGVAYRSFDVDDFLLNGLGAYLGIGLGKVCLEKIFIRGKRRD